MSTILKALRRLEEEGEQANPKPPSKMELDPSALSSDALREGIFQEEVASEAIAPTKPPARSWGRPAVLALAGGFVVAGLALGWTRFFAEPGSPGPNARDAVPVTQPAQPTPPQMATRTPNPPPDPAAFVKAEAAPPASKSASTGSATSDVGRAPEAAPPAERIPSGLARAAVRPTPAAASLAAEPIRLQPEAAAPKAVTNPAPAPPRVAAVTQRPAPKVASVPEPRIRRASPPAPSTPRTSPTPPTPPSPLEPPTPRASSRSAETLPPIRETIPLAEAAPVRPSAKPRPRDPVARSTPAPVAAKRFEDERVERLDGRGLTDVAVERTSWHPKADRRSAKIRVAETGEVLKLGEGDSVGGMIIREIKPSSVIFSAGGVEVSRRVGSGR